MPTNSSGTRRIARSLALSTASVILVGSMISCSGGGDTSSSEPTVATTPSQPASQSASDASTSGAPSTGADASSAAPTATQSSTPSSSTSSPTSSSASSASATAGAANGQTELALKAITTAESGVQGGEVFDLEDETERGERVWSAKVATPDDRQFNLAISQDGSSIVANDEDTTPDDDIQKLRSADISVSDAITTAAEQAQGQGDVTSLEIDTNDADAVVWQIEFGGDSGTTVLVDAVSGEVLEVGPDVG